MFLTIFNRRMECTFVRIRTNGTKDVLYNRTGNWNDCLPPQIGSDGTIYVVLPDELMALDSQANLQWTYKLQGLDRDDFVIRSFMLGANGTVFLNALASEYTTLGSQSPPSFPTFVAWQGVDKSGKLMWTLYPPSANSWYNWVVSEKGESFFIESIPQPWPLYPGMNCCPPPFSNRISLVRLDINGQISLNITLQGSPFLSFDEYDSPVSVNSVGDVMILACARTSFDITVEGHAVWYVVPRDGKNGWSFTPRNAPCGSMPMRSRAQWSVLHGSLSKDDALYAVSGDLLYKVIHPSLVDALEVSDPLLIV